MTRITGISIALVIQQKSIQEDGLIISRSFAKVHLARQVSVDARCPPPGNPSLMAAESFRNTRPTPSV